jgi:hypothetical protein
LENKHCGFNLENHGDSSKKLNFDQQNAGITQATKIGMLEKRMSTICCSFFEVRFCATCCAAPDKSELDIGKPLVEAVDWCWAHHSPCIGWDQSASIFWSLPIIAGCWFHVSSPPSEYETQVTSVFSWAKRI